jgi:hypothetical protein
MSKNKVPRMSANPFLNPAWLKGWQGNPAHRMSKSGILLFFMDVMSPTKLPDSKSFGEIL